MIQSMIYGADVEVVAWEQGKAILVTHPSGQQFVVPLSEAQAANARMKLADIALPPTSEAA